ncbi:TetR/AcrR family transcriptional regulator [Bailinhaonella thermotolerans]|uniref:TetR/AcrR family transcriptional regulator n=1 Tax=Bailinhaonella thermotolerans TaxID=1070861 RepID=UPI001F5BBF88|nr:TetR/AcrR family transcriptional regulator [Bailinhaonella thermotolerans]
MRVAGRGEPARERRAGRILDAAGELLVAWGYPRVTVDEVARRAGVGKGTIYLHFATKEQLFLTVLLRAQRGLMARVVAGMRERGEGVLLSEMARAGYLWAHEEPVARAVLLGDLTTLGALGASAAEVMGGLVEERDRVVEAHFRLLRDHGLIRGEPGLEAQIHAYSAILTGFLALEPLKPAPYPSHEENAAIVADVVRTAFETPGDPAALHAAAARAADHYQRLLDLMDEEIGRRQVP